VNVNAEREAPLAHFCLHVRRTFQPPNSITNTGDKVNEAWHRHRFGTDRITLIFITTRSIYSCYHSDQHVCLSISPCCIQEPKD
jgi:hypothetical protein